MQVLRWFAFFLAVAVFSVPASAQEKSEDERIRALEEEIRRIRNLYESRLQALEGDLDQMKKEKKKDALEELRRRAGERASQAERAQEIDEAAGRLTGPGSIISTRMNEFNPRITAFGDFVGRLDDRRVSPDRAHGHAHHHDDGEEQDASDRFSMSHFELAFSADVDPYAKAVAVVGLEELFDDFDIDLEECYLDVHTVPGLEEVPHNLRFKLGRFLTEFGIINRLHNHDLMWTTRPLPFVHFLGGHGCRGQGVGVSYLVHNPWDEAITLTAQVINGEHHNLFAGEDSNDLAYLGRAEWQKQVGDEFDLALGSSVLCGNAEGMDRDDETRLATLLGFDAFWRWRPRENQHQTSFLVQTEWFLRWREDRITDHHEDGDGVLDDRFRWGFYTAAQYQFMKNFYAGSRFDYLSGTDGAWNEWSYKLAAYLSYYTTEFLRFRIGYEHEEDDLGWDNETVYFQVTWVFGSHPAEPYWFNK